ncbi:hypothetical protein FA13DRAFT_1768192 [Coprinellus micaceus]|uniref:NAD(P)-binding domain-containing protein n=1 Tax=Coprinellus micaceus TaxID=71717 RepID=A0A4Y7S279_COPMI|nr:hypothetical protein FA13DRAFT_1768192 [Coprinellus micaceus]
MSDHKSLNILAIGASRNIGYYSSKKLLGAGATVTFLLRSPTVFDTDEEIQPYVKNGHAVLVKGDALVSADVQKAWDTASKDRPVDFLLFSVGGTPKFTFGKGFIIDPPNLVTQSLLNALSTMPKVSGVEDQTKIITLSSIGLTRTSHDSLPLPSNPYTAGSSIPRTKIRQKALVIRPALLTDGKCVAEKPQKEGKQPKEPYRVSEGELGGYTISRQDVAHFVVDVILNKWAQYENKIVNIGY